MTVAVGANLYTQGFGSRPENVEIPFTSTRNPASSDVNFPLGKRWINASGEWVLTSFTSSQGSISANWTQLGSPQAYYVALAGVTANLSAGTVTISSPLITTQSIIIYSAHTLSGTLGFWEIQLSNGQFNIVSDNVLDTSNFFYAVIN